jgi:hypothetical protein
MITCSINPKLICYDALTEVEPISSNPYVDRFIPSERLIMDPGPLSVIVVTTYYTRSRQLLWFALRRQLLRTLRLQLCDNTLMPMHILVSTVRRDKPVMVHRKVIALDHRWMFVDFSLAPDHEPKDCQHNKTHKCSDCDTCGRSSRNPRVLVIRNR